MKTLWLLVALFNGTPECREWNERFSHARIYEFATYDECSGKHEELISNGNDCRRIHECAEVDRVAYGDGEEAFD